LVAQLYSPPIGGNTNNPPSEEASSSAHIYMFNVIDLSTRTMTYDTPPTKPHKEKVANGTTTDPLSTIVTHPSRPLQIEKPNFESILRPAKRTI
jgi:hypothetical protein